MARLSIEIVGELLGSEDHEIRRKATRALGALGAPDVPRMLVGTALHDRDPQVRKQAERAIADMPHPGANFSKVFAEALEEHRRDTYALLGRLRLLGGHVSVPVDNWFKRLRNALVLGDDIRRQMGWAFWRRGFASAALGALIGYLVSLAVANGLDLRGEDSGTMLILAMLVSLLAPMIAVWTTPIQLHFDRTGGMVADALVVALLTLALAVALGTASEAMQSPMFRLWLVVTSLATPAVRVTVGLIGGYVRMRFVGFLVTMLSAGCAGSLIFTLLLWFVARRMGVDLNDVEWWGSCWPLMFGLAAVFGWLDNPQSVTWRLASRRARQGAQALASDLPFGSNWSPKVALGALLAIWCACFLTLFLSIPGSSRRADGAIRAGEPIVATTTRSDTQSRVVKAVPVSYDLRLTERGLLAVNLKRLGTTPADGYRVAIETLRPESTQGENNSIQRVVPAPLADTTQALAGGFRALGLGAGKSWDLDLDPRDESVNDSRTLEAGTYRVVLRKQDVTSTDIAKVVSRVKRKLAMTGEAPANLDLSVVLAPASLPFSTNENAEETGRAETTDRHDPSSRSRSSR